MTKNDPRLTPARPDLAAAHLRGQVVADDFVEGRKVQIRTGLTDLRHAPAYDSPIDTQALYGETAILFEDFEGWGWVQLERDGYVGYMAMAALDKNFTPPTHWVKTNRSFIYPGPDLKLPPLDALPLGAKVRVLATQGSFAKIADCSFVFAAHLAPDAETETDFVAVAERFLHTPYLWGGKSSLGLDCSGLVQVALGAAGIDAPRDTDLQERALGAALSLGADLKRDDIQGLARGDLVFWPGHVGIMRDETMLLHANAHHMLVASEPLATARDRILAKTGAPISAIKRL